MQVIETLQALRGELVARRRAGSRIALVPTMGSLHAGHLRLVERARELSDYVCVSIFVNPLQFDRPDDLAAYPRSLEADCRLLQAQGADVVFVPQESQVYPLGREACRVSVPGLSQILEGASRAGHFDGVTTVVAKLFNMVQPDLAVFGEKDYQQLLLIRRMVAALDFALEIVGEATVREADGLAMSSRNAYLDTNQRKTAPVLYQTLQLTARALRAGRQDYDALSAEALNALDAAGFSPDYVSLRRAGDLAPVAPGERAVVILAAAWLGRARLIDNLSVAL